MLLKDSVTIITGGGSGIGQAACLRFAEEGAIVFVADYNLSSAGETVALIKGRGFNAHAVRVDVTSPASVKEMVDLVIGGYDRVDVLVNNAGITRDSTIKKMTYTQWQEVIDTNLNGVFNCTSAVIPYMIEDGYGRIINTSSVVGTSGNFGQVNYAATKGGVIAFTKSLAKELGPKGINSNAVAPGFILTPMVKAMPEKVIKAMEEKIPLGHLGDPRDVANAYLFLASPMASYVNGTVLEVDGGILF